eukprot:GSMAST32.ASY1.ANO1.2347.1 assembled CDS
MTASRPRTFTGLDLHCCPDLVESLNNAVKEHFDFVVAPLVHPRFHRDDNGISAGRQGPFTRTDKVMPSGQWTTMIVGKISRWFNLDSVSDNVRATAEKTLFQELAWATHLSVPAILLPPLYYNCINYARCISQKVAIPGHAQIDISDMSNDNQPSLDVSADPWEAWNRFRCMCNHSPSLFVCLVFTKNLPSWEEQTRWLSEPIKAVVIPTEIFLTNSSGFPTLSPLMSSKVQVLIRGNMYALYINHMKADLFEEPYYDVLQAPLQPLMDNLESATYEVFERDPVKYKEYENATFHALEELKKRTLVPIIMVVGAGRGPLIRAALRASEKVGQKVKIYAVEKNQNAVVTLKSLHNDLQWGEDVVIVSCDMRHWNAPVKADIMISELLGSFSDNLSPECLYGVQTFLKDTGVSIPCQYTSFVAPITSSKLWNKVRAHSHPTKKPFETGYVVKMHNFKQLAEAKPCFTFNHPLRPISDINNNRYKILKFKQKEGTMVHGFAGYFESPLHQRQEKDCDAFISINPKTFSLGMFSWFPLYLPLKTPFYCKKGEEIELHMWRCVSSTKVWYEWSVVTPVLSSVHNVNGQSHWIGL